jgi:hypothetical protein
MSLLLIRPVTPEQEVLIGDLVHLSVAARPAAKRCTPAIVTMTLSPDTGTHVRLRLHEMTDQTGNAAAKYPAGGWRHVSDAPAAPATWHTRAECPDGK